MTANPSYPSNRVLCHSSVRTMPIVARSRTEPLDADDRDSKNAMVEAAAGAMNSSP
jgi:hypothetical protein